MEDGNGDWGDDDEAKMIYIIISGVEKKIAYQIRY